MWVHSDHGDHSDSWQLTGHSTTQEAFICHFLSRPSCNTMPLGFTDSVFHSKTLKKIWKWKWHTTHLFAEPEVNRFAVATYTVQHAGFDAISTNCSVTQLTGTPICRVVFHQQNISVTLTIYCHSFCIRISSSWSCCLSLTSDVIGVVEAVAVEFAGLCLCRRRTLLLLSRLTKGVSTPLPGTVPTTWLRGMGNNPDLFILLQ